MQKHVNSTAMFSFGDGRPNSAKFVCSVLSYRHHHCKDVVVDVNGDGFESWSGLVLIPRLM